jgi:hypothetical protein
MCDGSHAFESWFPSSESYDDQAARGLVACPVCGSARVAKGMMAPAIARTDRAVHQQAFFVDERGQPVAAEHLCDPLARTRIGIELGIEHGGIVAVAHDLALRPRTTDQRQRTDDDRLAGTGFTGQHVEPTAELELDILEQREAADVQVGEHFGSAEL